MYDNYFIGDGRNDSPGHCAQYCTYTLMDCESKSIVSTITVDKRETSLNSVNMEKLALHRSLEVLSGKLDISELVTDAHVQIAAYISESCYLVSVLNFYGTVFLNTFYTCIYVLLNNYLVNSVSLNFHHRCPLSTSRYCLVHSRVSTIAMTVGPTILYCAILVIVDWAIFSPDKTVRHTFRLSFLKKFHTN